MYLTPAESNSVNNASDPMPDNEILMRMISFKSVDIKGRLNLFGVLLAAANQMIWRGEARIYVPHKTMPKQMLDAFISEPETFE